VTDPVVDSLTSDSISTGGIEIDETYHYAADDAELDEKLSSASRGDTIYLGNSDFAHDRTISTKGVTIISSSVGSESAEFSGSLTFDAPDIVIAGGHISGSVTVNDSACAIIRGNHAFGMGGITISADTFRYVNNREGELTFESGTSGGIVDACTQVTVTDNGTNTVGDIA
jgi:hypothetical protein